MYACAHSVASIAGKPGQRAESLEHSGTSTPLAHSQAQLIHDCRKQYEEVPCWIWEWNEETISLEEEDKQTW